MKPEEGEELAFDDDSAEEGDAEGGATDGAADGTADAWGGDGDIVLAVPTTEDGCPPPSEDWNANAHSAW